MRAGRKDILGVPARIMLLAVLAVLGGCSMANSLQVPTAGEKGCHSSLGAYFLPRDDLHVEVRQVDPVAPNDSSAAAQARRVAPKYEIALIELRSTADRTRGFCLDYLGSRVSNDYLEVKREGGLLIKVGTTNRAYADIADKQELPDTIQTEDTTVKSIAKRLIDETMTDVGEPVDKVTYPWAGRPMGANSVPGNEEKDKAFKEDQRRLLFFCEEQKARAGSGTPEAKTFFNEFCETDGTPKKLDGPAAATLRAYFTGQLMGRPEKGVPVADGAMKKMRRVVYRPQAKPYVPSGGYREEGDATAAARGFSPDPTEDLKTLQRSGWAPPPAEKKLHYSHLWQTDTSFSADFDPASPAQAAVSNSGLRDFGFCLLLNDGQVPITDRDSYCDDPLGYGRRKGWNAHTGDRFEGYVSYGEGLLYRPRLNYTLYVFKKKERKLPGGWQLDGQHLVSVPNLAPMISVGVSRTLFANRNTVIEFDRGALLNIAIRKDSELVNALDIPLSLVRRVTEMPTNIVKLRIRNTDASRQLAEKQKELLEAEISYNKTLKELRDARAGSAEAGINQ